VLATLVLLRLYFRNERCRRAGTHSQPDMETA
jgi:hypothetical protein